jgi:FkbM family methyltransferase
VLINKTADNAENTSMIQLLTKAIRTFAHKGISIALKMTIWKLYYERFKRKRTILELQKEFPSVIRFLGNDFELHPSKAGLTQELLLYGVHEPVATRFYQQFLSLGDHVIDVGSNIGYFLLKARKSVGREGRLIGFEPVPSLYDILMRNVVRSGYQNIEVFPWAIGAKCGSREFYESEIPNWGSLFQNHSLLQTGTITVQVKTVDEIVRNSPGLYPKALRMDLEGGELMVLEGAQEVLHAYKPLLFIEFHNFYLGWDAIRAAVVRLCDMGYSSGIVIERMWDQPWISNWIRKRRCWRGDIKTLLERIESRTHPFPLEAATFTFFLKAPNERTSRKKTLL